MPRRRKSRAAPRGARTRPRCPGWDRRRALRAPGCPTAYRRPDASSCWCAAPARAPPPTACRARCRAKRDGSIGLSACSAAENTSALSAAPLVAIEHDDPARVLLGRQHVEQQRLEEPGGIGGDAVAQLIAQPVLAGGLQRDLRADRMGTRPDAACSPARVSDRKQRPWRQRQLRRRPSRELAVDLDLRAGRLAGELDAAAGPRAHGGARRLVRLADGGRVVGLVQLDVDRRLGRARERLGGARVTARLRDAPLQQLHAHVRRLVPHRRGQAIDDLAAHSSRRAVAASKLERQEVGLRGAHQLVEAAFVVGDRRGWSTTAGTDARRCPG